MGPPYTRSSHMHTIWVGAILLLAGCYTGHFAKGAQCLQRPGRNYTLQPIIVISSDRGGGYRRMLHDCSVPCLISGEVSAWATADAWLERIPSKARAQRPPKVCPLQSFILLSQESEAYYSSLNPRAAREGGWDLLATTSQRSDVPLTYASNRYDWLAPPMPFSNKTKAAAVFISNCDAKNERLELVEALIKAGFPVNSYGKCLHNANAGASRAAKMQVLRKHLFTLAFENSNEPGYVTEKYYQALAAGSVPVYLGAPDIGDFAPTAPAASSLVAVSAFKGGVKERAEGLAARLWGLARSEAEYGAMLAWKRGPLGGPLAEQVARGAASNCRLCRAVRARIESGLKSAPAPRNSDLGVSRGLRGGLEGALERQAGGKGRRDRPRGAKAVGEAEASIRKALRSSAEASSGSWHSLSEPDARAFTRVPRGHKRRATHQPTAN